MYACSCVKVSLSQTKALDPESLKSGLHVSSTSMNILLRLQPQQWSILSKIFSYQFAFCNLLVLYHMKNSISSSTMQDLNQALMADTLTLPYFTHTVIESWCIYGTCSCKPMSQHYIHVYNRWREVIIHFENEIEWLLWILSCNLISRKIRVKIVAHE